MKFISIISVSLNNENGLRRTLSSIRSQSSRNYELIVIDGGSTDGTAKLIEKNYDIVDAYVSEPDTGVYNAQNKGLLMAKGHYLLFLNAGDVFCDQFVLENIEKTIDPSENIIYGDILVSNPDGQPTRIYYPDSIGYYYWLSQNYLCHQAVFIDRKLFEEYGCYNEKYRFAADFEFLQRFWFKSGIKKRHIDVPVVVYDLNGMSADPKNTQKVLREYNEIMQAYFPLFIIYSFYCLKILKIIKKITTSILRKIFSFLLRVANVVRVDLKKVRSFFLQVMNVAGFVLKRGNVKSYKKYCNQLDDRPLVLHLSFADLMGGAARAAYRINDGLRNGCYNSVMVVMIKQSHNPHVLEAIPVTGLNWFKECRKRIRFGKMKFGGNNYSHNGFHSTQVYSYIDIEKILLTLRPDIIHLHWIGDNMISIEDMSKITCPVVWTLHDMWPFCGAEHVSFDEQYIFGYDEEKEVTLNRWVWQRKREVYKNLKMNVVGVSGWISQAAKNSLLLRGKNICTIPNIIDVEVFKPYNKISARHELAVPSDKLIILFGADFVDQNKGYETIRIVMRDLSKMDIAKEIAVVIFGHFNCKMTETSVEIFKLGYVSDNKKLAKIFSAADVVLISSKIESFCLTAAEAISCGTPVVSFDTSGLKDIVINGLNGYKAKCYDPNDFLQSTLKVLSEQKEGKYRPEQLHDFIVKNFSPDLIIRQYVDLYNKILLC